MLELFYKILSIVLLPKLNSPPKSRFDLLLFLETTWLSLRSEPKAHCIWCLLGSTSNTLFGSTDNLSLVGEIIGKFFSTMRNCDRKYRAFDFSKAERFKVKCEIDH
mmetsp:Transcript_18032/g.24822  ORF Transcript_18032/g.24822 Transcript_18032/m.24822 type:complete len:106 (-) Transcript_18032:1588-1905(-)